MPETALSLVYADVKACRRQAIFYAWKEDGGLRKLKKYTPTQFMAKDSVYDKAAADYAVTFIEALKHTKGKWAGNPLTD